jgi:hypothetical protein
VQLYTHTSQCHTQLSTLFIRVLFFVPSLHMPPFPRCIGRAAVRRGQRGSRGLHHHHGAYRSPAATATTTSRTSISHPDRALLSRWALLGFGVGALVSAVYASQLQNESASLKFEKTTKDWKERGQIVDAQPKQKRLFLWGNNR